MKKLQWSDLRARWGHHMQGALSVVLLKQLQRCAGGSPFREAQEGAQRALELLDVSLRESGAQDGNRSEAFFDGPQAWEEVDAEELERIAVNIARAAVPSTESLEVGARLAMQAAAMEAESADPLGLGRVDTRGLALVRHV